MLATGLIFLYLFLLGLAKELDKSFQNSEEEFKRVQENEKLENLH